MEMLNMRFRTIYGMNMFCSGCLEQILTRSSMELLNYNRMVSGRKHISCYQAHY